MTRIVAMFVLALAVLAGLPVTAEAQGNGWVWSKDQYGRPRLINLADPTTWASKEGVYVPGYPGTYGQVPPTPYPYGVNPRQFDACYDAQNYYEGIRGYFHFNRKKVEVVNARGKKRKVEAVWKHFRACDPSNHPVRNRETAMWTGAAGAGIGAVIADTKGAVIGTIAGAALGSLLGDDHGDCVPVGPPTIPEMGATVLPPAQADGQRKGGESASYQEPETSRSVEEKEEPVLEKKIVRNRFEDAPIRVYVGSKRLLELPAGSDDGEITIVAGSRVWGEAQLENPKNGKKEWTPLQPGKGIDSLPESAGWVFGNPNSRPSLE